MRGKAYETNCWTTSVLSRKGEGGEGGGGGTRVLKDPLVCHNEYLNVSVAAMSQLGRYSNCHLLN